MSTKYIASNWRLPNKAGVDSYLNDNYGLTFDGSEFISAGTPLNGLTTFSLSIWAFRSTDQALNDAIIAYQDSTANFWKLFFNSSTDSTEIRMLDNVSVNGNITADNLAGVITTSSTSVVNSTILKDAVTLLIKDSSGSTVKTVIGAGS